MHTRIFATADDWALSSDGIQWMLMKRSAENRPNREPWQAVSFVRSEREIITRCMREKGVGADAMRSLLAALPDTFDAWQALQHAIQTPLQLEQP